MLLLFNPVYLLEHFVLSKGYIETPNGKSNN